MATCEASDADLVRRVQADDDRDALGELVHRHTGLALSAVRRHGAGLGRDDAEQEAMLAVVQAARTYDPKRGTQFSTWVYNCVFAGLAKAKKSEHKHRKQRVKGGVDVVDALPDAKAVDPLSAAIINERNTRLAALLADLPERDLRILWRRRALGWTCTEVARAEGVTKQRVEQIERRAKDRLRELIAKSGLSESDWLDDLKE